MGSDISFDGDDRPSPPDPREQERILWTHPAELPGTQVIVFERKGPILGSLWTHFGHSHEYIMGYGIEPE